MRLGYPPESKSSRPCCYSHLSADRKSTCSAKVGTMLHSKAIAVVRGGGGVGMIAGVMM